MKLNRKSWIFIIVSIFLLYLAMYYWPAISKTLSGIIAAAVPVVIGLILAYVLNILMTFYERIYFQKSKKPAIIKSRRPVCLIASLLTLCAILAIIVALIVPEFIDCMALLIEKVPDTVDLIIDKLEEFEIISPELIKSLRTVDWGSRIKGILDTIGTGVGNVMNFAIETIMSLVGGIVTAFISIIFAVYLLISKDRMIGQIHRLMDSYVKSSHRERIYYVARVFNESFRKYIVGQCTEAVILGVLCIIGMLIFNMPYATMIGALIAFTALIPIAGAWIGAAVGAFMILTVSPMKALMFLVFILVLQQLEGNIIYPKVVGSSIGLPAFWVLVAVTVGGGIFGVAGMLFGVPLMAAIYRIIRHDVRKRESEAKPKVEQKA